MSIRPDFLTQHMEALILEMTLDRFPTRAIIQELRRLYPKLSERNAIYAITYVHGGG